jgi:hypothetical protein
LELDESESLSRFRAQTIDGQIKGKGVGIKSRMENLDTYTPAKHVVFKLFFWC